jgi:hypothetical protein
MCLIKRYGKMKMYFSLFTVKSPLRKTLKECMVLDARILANITQNTGRIKIKETFCVQ